MTQEKQKAKLQKMLKKCLDVLTPMKAVKWAPVGKNTIYAAIKSGEIETFVYKGGYIFTKDTLIDYLVKTADQKGRNIAVRGGRHDDRSAGSPFRGAGAVRPSYQQTQVRMDAEQRLYQMSEYRQEYKKVYRPQERSAQIYRGPAAAP